MGGGNREWDHDDSSDQFRLEPFGHRLVAPVEGRLIEVVAGPQHVEILG